MSNYRGEKYIRFGEFSIGKDITKDMIEDVESCLIFGMQPIHNVHKKSSYTFTNEYRIVSSGNRGFIPKEISTRNQ